MLRNKEARVRELLTFLELNGMSTRKQLLIKFPHFGPGPLSKLCDRAVELGLIGYVAGHHKQGRDNQYFMIPGWQEQTNLLQFRVRKQEGKHSVYEPLQQLPYTPSKWHGVNSIFDYADRCN